MKDFRTLQVWERSHTLTLKIYKVTQDFPKQEVYGLTSQLRRSASSIPTNIAEGCGRKGDAELCRFLHIAAGSASEVEYQVFIAHDLGYIDAATYESLNSEINQVKRMLNTFSQKLRANS